MKPCIYNFFFFKILINLSATTDFSPLYVEYISILLLCKNDFIDLLSILLPLSTHILFVLWLDSFKIFWKALVIVMPFLSFKGTSNNKHDWNSKKYLNVLHHNRTQCSCNNFFLIYCKNITNFLFWVFWTCMATFIKKDNTNLYKLWRLSACQNWPPFVTSFLRYCKNIANLLLWVIWKCLIMPTNNDNINLVGNFDAQSVFWETLMFICWQKINSIFNFFFETLQTCYFGNFGNTWPSQSKSYYQLVASFYNYLHAKNQLHLSILS